MHYYEKFTFAEILKYCRVFFAEKDNSPGKTIVEGKICRGSSLKYHQSIAALLMFSKIQRPCNRSESDAFPMLVVCRTDVVILIYQPETDTLVITQVLPWEKVAYFFVWAVLHHSIFPIKIPVSKECGYKKATVNISFDDYWYLTNRNVLQANTNSELTTVYEWVFRIASGSD